MLWRDVKVPDEQLAVELTQLSVHVPKLGVPALNGASYRQLDLTVCGFVFDHTAGKMWGAGSLRVIITLLVQTRGGGCMETNCV